MRMKQRGPIAGAAAWLALVAIFWVPVSSGEDFQDVVPGTGFGAVIDHITDLGIMEGCREGFFCPKALVNREEMAVWLERVQHYGGTFPGLPAEPTFDDVPFGSCMASWIEWLHADGITRGCRADPPLFCPGKVISRAEMAVFLVRVTHGPDFVPMECRDETFDDVDCNASWPPGDYIEQIAADGITGGCSVDPPEYCPYGAVTREQMAAFLTKVMNIKYCTTHSETCWTPSGPITDVDDVPATLDSSDEGHELVGG